jgi:prepilin-type N-terminal cleavage/methylation domain-containing protein
MEKKNKKGFTLVELMLAIALIALISTLFISLMVAIKESY